VRPTSGGRPLSSSSQMGSSSLFGSETSSSKKKIDPDNLFNI